MKFVCALLLVAALVAIVAGAGIDPMRFEAKEQNEQGPGVVPVDGQLERGSVKGQKRGLYGYGWGGPGFYGGGYGWGGHPGGYYGGWGPSYGYGYGWGGYFY